MPTGSKLVTIDLKDFFYSGTIMDLIDDCAYFVVAPITSFLKEALRILLNYQYVCLGSTATFFKCIRGSGMGLPHSGTVANLSFLKRVELPLVDSSVFRACKVHIYKRYHDDIFAVHSSSEGFLSFYYSMQSKAHHFVLKCTNVSSKGLKYLDTHICIHGTRLIVEPDLSKPVMPLSATSGHSISVHRSWPSALAHRVEFLASKSNFEHALRSVISKYRVCNASECTLRILCSALNKTDPTVLPHPNSALQRNSAVASKWVKISFHPLWQRTLPRILASVGIPPHFTWRPRIAWRNSFGALESCIASSNRLKIQLQTRRC